MKGRRTVACSNEPTPLSRGERRRRMLVVREHRVDGVGVDLPGNVQRTDRECARRILRHGVANAGAAAQRIHDEA